MLSHISAEFFIGTLGCNHSSVWHRIS